MPLRDDQPLLDLLALLRARGYRFVTPTPATHARVVARPNRQIAQSLADVLGWSLPFAPDLLDPQLFETIEAAGVLEAVTDGMLRSRIRVSALMGDLYAHSAFPTDGRDAVFFGPDSYRFARSIEQELARLPLPPQAHVADIGTGAGVGAIVAAKLSDHARATGIDVNAQALRFAQINARHAGIALNCVLGDGVDGIRDPIDLALANPPYIIDDAGRRYRDGGAMHGGEIALNMAEAALPRLAPGGRLLLYTGSAIVQGEDALHEALRTLAARQGCTLHYEELDPDVFGEELAREAYAEVDRIALVAAVCTRQA